MTVYYKGEINSILANGINSSCAVYPEETAHVLSAFGMDSACTVRLWHGQCMYCHPLEWTVHVLSAFRMDSACTVSVCNGQWMYCQTLE